MPKCQSCKHALSFNAPKDHFLCNNPLSSRYATYVLCRPITTESDVWVPTFKSRNSLENLIPVPLIGIILIVFLIVIILFVITAISGGFNG